MSTGAPLLARCGRLGLRGILLLWIIPAGIVEERGIETIFKGQHQLCHALSFIVRTANTFVGSLLWVDFVRLLGMQTAKKAPEAAPAVAAPKAEEDKKKKK